MQHFFNIFLKYTNNNLGDLMFNRTDLAVEKLIDAPSLPKSITNREVTHGDITVAHTRVADNDGAVLLGKPIGDYITVTLPHPIQNCANTEEAEKVIAEEINKLLPQSPKSVLVLGLGNRDITPDALGPKTAECILATRHITKALADEIGLSCLKSVAVISPGVLGQTGIETGEILAAVVARIKPSAVIVIDALAAKSIKRLGVTVQLSNTGITPGAGVGNARQEINKKTLGVPVISIGIPTVVEAATLIYDLLEEEYKKNSDYGKMIVTPREIDTIIEQSARLLGLSLNRALQPEIDSEILRVLV